MTGFISVNKKAGVSSAKEVSIIKKLTGTPCGHLGTLDPMASGVLPIAIGNAARLFDYFLTKQKTYVATFKFGVDSDTLDTTGKVVETGGYIPTERELLGVLPKMCGEIMQIPPKFSAKNVNGKRGYELARAGVEFELAPKRVNIYDIKLLNRPQKDSYEFEIVCGGGTYIRSIARDLAKLLNTNAIMSALKRTKSGAFVIENSVESEVLSDKNIKDFIIPTDSVLPFEGIKLGLISQKRLLNGLTDSTDKPDGIYKIYCTDGSFYGLAEAKDSILKVRTKLC